MKRIPQNFFNFPRWKKIQDSEIESLAWEFTHNKNNFWAFFYKKLKYPWEIIHIHFSKNKLDIFVTLFEGLKWSQVKKYWYPELLFPKIWVSQLVRLYKMYKKEKYLTKLIN